MSVSTATLRTKLLKKNIGASLFFRGGSIAVNFLLVPLTIDYLDKESYGIWLIITSVVGWSTFFDLGLGHGLKNKFAESLAKDDHDSARTYVSTTYAYLAMIVGGMLLLFFGIFPFVEWAVAFNASSIADSTMGFVMTIAFGFFCLRLLFGLVGTLLSAIQLPMYNDAINFGSNGLALLIIYLLTKLTTGSLVHLALIMSGIPVLLFICVSLFVFNGKLKKYKPSMAFVSFREGRSLLNMGMQFFIIQIAGIVIFNTDNFIITHALGGPEKVVPYNVAFKYFGLITLGFSIICTPFWSAYTDAYHRKEYDWIKNITTKLFRILLFFWTVCIAMVILSEFAYDLWIDDRVQIPFTLTLAMAAYVCVISWGSIFVTFVNGVGKIRLQLIFSIAAGLANIPLSIFLGKHMGSAGVILATTICLSYGPLVSYIQYRKIINQSARGIWNK